MRGGRKEGRRGRGTKERVSREKRVFLSPRSLSLSAVSRAEIRAETSKEPKAGKGEGGGEENRRRPKKSSISSMECDLSITFRPPLRDSRASVLRIIYAGEGYVESLPGHIFISERGGAKDESKGPFLHLPTRIPFILPFLTSNAIFGTQK